MIFLKEEETTKESGDKELKKTLRTNKRASEQSSKGDCLRMDEKSVSFLLNHSCSTRKKQKSVGHKLSVLDGGFVQNRFSVVHASCWLEPSKAFRIAL